ncbi:MAG: hypothetical protein N3D10_03410 [Candidatus Micrarchaeota archaeon]|nr:hypothetical protein [Candidatus Micrarchaeota archaeon]
MPYDSFSNEPILAGKGIMYVKKDGTVLYFKNSKTLKNMLKLKRDGRLVKWTQKTVVLEGKKKEKQVKESELAKDIEQKLKEKEAQKKAKEQEQKK